MRRRELITIPSKTDCIHEGGLTLQGSLTKPEFIFRF
jgi:hypothetical protein